MLDLGTLGLRISVDDSELSGLGDKVSSASSKLKGGLAGAGKVAGKAIVAGMAAAGTATAALGKQALDAYSNYEQLSGGINKLFGEEASATVMSNASNAFATAGLSANEYMDTVTSFSASLISSLGGDTEAAASIADQAIQDMSDNANVFGTNIESIQNAYQGFAKGQYNMLDNLKLGYGGTKTEMERLLADAEELSGVHYDIDNFSDVAKAIHVIQEEQGIAGTTAKEAATTIEGSINMTKAAWQNMITGMADDNADFDSLMENLMTSLESAMNNILPRIGTILENVGTFIVQASQTIVPDLIAMLMGMIPQLLQAGTALLNGILEGFKQALPSIVEALPMLIETLTNFVVDNIGLVIEIGITLLLGIINGLIEALPQLIDAVPQIIKAIVTTLINNLPQIVSTGAKVIPALIKGVLQLLGNLFQLGSTLVGKVVSGIIGGLSRIRSIGSQVVSNLKAGIANAWGSITGWIREKMSSLFSFDTIKGWFGKGHRIGIKEVPYDGYQAVLHKGETVLTAAETNQVKKGLNVNPTQDRYVEINFNGNYNFRDKDDINYFINQSQKLINRRLAL